TPWTSCPCSREAPDRTSSTPRRKPRASSRAHSSHSSCSDATPRPSQSSLGPAPLPCDGGVLLPTLLAGEPEPRVRARGDLLELPVGGRVPACAVRGDRPRLHDLRSSEAVEQ